MHPHMSWHIHLQWQFFCSFKVWALNVHGSSCFPHWQPIRTTDLNESIGCKYCICDANNFHYLHCPLNPTSLAWLMVFALYHFLKALQVSDKWSNQFLINVTPSSCDFHLPAWLMNLRTFLDILWGTSHVPPWSLSSLLLGYIILLFAANQPPLDEMSGPEKCMIKHRMETGDGTRSPHWGLQDGKELQKKKKALAVFFLVDTPRHDFLG